MPFKQVPVNLGNFVVVNDDASGAGAGYVWLYTATNNGNTPSLTSGVVGAPDKSDSSNGKGTVYRDLGVTYIEKASSGSMQNVYRKVVKASDSALNPTEYFIKVVNAYKTSGQTNGSDAGSVQFARLG